MCTDDKNLGTNQPALYHDDVNTLIGYIGAERNNAEGLDRAHEIVSSMWEAAVLTTNAANANLTKEERPE